MTNADCRKCSLYDASNRWCRGGKRRIRNPTTGSCRHYDGPREWEEAPAPAPSAEPPTEYEPQPNAVLNLAAGLNADGSAPASAEPGSEGRCRACGKEHPGLVCWHPGSESSATTREE